jgi:hypothetical protein
MKNKHRIFLTNSKTKIRMKKVKHLRNENASNPELKLIYGEGGNLLLIRKKFFKWRVLDQTGPWIEESVS